MISLTSRKIRVIPANPSFSLPHQILRNFFMTCESLIIITSQGRMKSCQIFSKPLHSISFLWRKSNWKYFHASALKYHGEYEMKDPTSSEKTVRVTFVDKENNKLTVKGKVGDNLLYLAHKFNVEMEGACEASLACTTCHCYVDYNFLSRLPEPDEKEEDLLDMAPFLKENSRLGCQIILNKDLDGIEIKLPLATRNFYVDGHKPKPH